MEKLKQSSDTYDEQYEEGGHAGVYKLPYRQSPYYPLYRAVLEELLARRATCVLEVGCGNGCFGQMVLEKTDIEYLGFDFSRVAVEMAVARTNRPEAFRVGDARSPESYAAGHEYLVCTEVLEHIPDDLEVIRLWRSGVSCICSVPNFDSRYHVRHFRSEKEVRRRYGELIDIDKLGFRRCPPVERLHWKPYAKWILRGVIRPRWLWEALGLREKAPRYGWFIFCGTRR